MSDTTLDCLPSGVADSSGGAVKPMDVQVSRDPHPVSVVRPPTVLMEEFPHLAANLLSALTPFRPVAVDELDVLTGALSDIGRAVRDEILTPAESEALVRAVIQRFAGRQVVDAMASAFSSSRA